MKLFVLIIALIVPAFSAPQLISYSKDGKLGVNFGGYHAAVGLGGILGGGTGGGLFAEAGTPHGQAARAGLGGAVDSNGQSTGGLYAGATAGGNVQASAGLGGTAGAAKTAGGGFAQASAGDKAAGSGLGGETSVQGSSGFTFSGSKSFSVNGGVKPVVQVAPATVVTQEVEEEINAVPLQQVAVKPVHKKVHTQINVDAVNEIKPVAPVVTVSETVQPVTVIKEVYAPPTVIEKHVTRVHRVKPHRHFHKTAYIGGYVGVPAPAPVPVVPVEQVVYKTVQAPVIQKRIDVNAHNAAEVEAVAHGGAQYGVTKTVSYQRNPNFFADIFNIPIQTLKAVGNFLGNAAGSTNISVQKTASVHAGY